MLYASLPVALQNVAVSIYGLRWRNRRFGGVFEKELLGFKQREDFTAVQWRDYQTVHLRRLLVHAFETVPYYRRIYTEVGFCLDDFKFFELGDLKRLPYLEKDDLRKYGHAELLSSRRSGGGKFFASSGSTGTPTSIFYTPMFHQRWSAAFEARIRYWANLDRHMARGMIGGRRVIPNAEARPPYYRYNWFEKQTYFSAYHISPHTAVDYLRGIQDNRVAYMTGYAMSNFFLARMFRELGLEAPKLRAVVVSSEKLTPEMRAVFREVYACRTYDSYSGVEACRMISEHESGALMSSPDVAVLEFLDEEGRDVAPGETGEIVCTGLLNFDQPLIRYRIGDMAKRSAASRSQSGLEMPIVDEIVGRIEDKVVGPDQREMVRFHGIFVDVPDLVSAQVVQKELDWIHVRAVTDAGFGQTEENLIADRLRSQLGHIRVTLERVDELPRNGSGKIPAVISELKDT